MKDKKSYEKATLTALHVPIEEMMPLIRDKISSGGSVELNTRGVSMLPMLREGRDSVILTAKRGRLKKFDIALYRRDTGAYVLHRAVKVTEGGYLFVGDAQDYYERVRDDSIIAVVTAHKRGGKLMSLTSPRYKLYCFFRYNLRRARRLVLRLRRKLARAFKKSKK